MKYEDRLHKLSPFIGTFMQEEKRNTSGACQGTKYFSYKGEVLDDIRTRIENSESLGCKIIRNMAVENIIRDKKGIQSGHKMPCLSRKFEK